MLGTFIFCAFNRGRFFLPLLHRAPFSDVSIAKYQEDGSIYAADSGSFRLVKMNAEGQAFYTITIDKMKEYVRIMDFAADGDGNLFVYAMETEYDAYLTKRDMIRQYDSRGSFVKTIFEIDYEAGDLVSPDNPRTAPQIGSLFCGDGYLSFSRLRRNEAELYCYDIYREKLDKAVFAAPAGKEEDPAYPRDFSLARLCLRDFNNFVYTTRRGGIYEVRDGREPVLRSFYVFSEDEGGIIPWDIYYGEADKIVFYDMISGRICYDNAGGQAVPVLPFSFFGEEDMAGLKGFGFDRRHYAGVADGTVWYHDGSTFRTYEDGFRLPQKDRILVIAVRTALALGAAAFVICLYLLFVRILDYYISIFIKQTIIIIPLSIAALVFLYHTIGSYLTGQINQEIFNQLVSTAATASKLINGGEIAALQSSQEYGGEVYRKNLMILKAITGLNRDEWNKANYAAIYKVVNGRQYYLIQSNDEVNMFRPYAKPEPDSKEYRLIHQGTVFADSVDNIYGSWAYANVPIYDRGSITGIFEIGRDITSYRISSMKQREQVVIIMAGICGIITIALALVVSIIVRQLSSVAGVLGNITSGDYSVRIKYRSRDELGRVSSGLNRMVEELQSQFDKINRLKESSLRFVPVQFMEHLGVTDITRMKLGDHVQRSLTVLFFDIRSFSINSEMMTARENFIFINKILSLAGPIIRSHRGFVDKFIGDAAMALFTDARDAVRAGIELYRKLVLDKRTRIKIGVDGINIGVGINSGSVMMGIVGEEERLSSTVISPTVNMASRVEGLTKQTRSGMLITRNTMNEIGRAEEFTFRFIGMIRAAGLNEVAGLFDILDALPVEVKKRRMETKQIFESGIRKYHTRDYQAAEERFRKVLALDSKDACARICLEETAKRLKDPKLPSVFVFDKK